MSNGINKVTLMGNLGADPELRFTNSKMPVANFRMATSRRFKDKQGETQERTEWHRVVVFGKLAENCNTYLSKGRQVYVEGHLQTRQWQDREGQTRYTTEIVASSVNFLGGRNKREEEVPSAEVDASQELASDDAPF